MSREDLREHLAGLVKKAEDSLERFRTAVAEHGLRIREGDVHGERDTTDQHLQDLEAARDEYRRLMRAWFGE
jgi:hypothetical protein